MRDKNTSAGLCAKNAGGGGGGGLMREGGAYSRDTTVLYELCSMDDNGWTISRIQYSMKKAAP